MIVWIRRRDSEVLDRLTMMIWSLEGSDVIGPHLLDQKTREQYIRKVLDMRYSGPP